MDVYVTYEVGKKLKKKGYSHDYNDFGYRLIYSDECTIKFISDIGAYEQEYYGENIPCPSISEVLKWLREKKEVDLVIEPIFFFDKNKRREYSVRVLDPTLNKSLHCGYFNTWEKAAFAGIEYALDNLI